MEVATIYFPMITTMVVKNGITFTLNTLSQGKSSLTGPAFGLSLVLNIEQEDYLKGGQTLAAGARISVQDGDVEPLVEE